MDTEIGLRELLSNETIRQKRSYRRATMLIALVALAGAAWLAFSAINVVRLERRARGLNDESTKLQQQIDNQRKELESKKADLTAVSTELAKADEALHTAETNLTEGNPKEALKVVSNAIKVRKPTPGPTPIPRPTPQDQKITIRFHPDESLDYISMNLNSIQQQQFVELVSLSVEPGGAANIASFRTVDIERASRIPPINLIALPEGEERSVIQAQRARGKVLIVRASIFVNGTLTKIAAFK
jgi:hypothetical protein